MDKETTKRVTKTTHRVSRGKAGTLHRSKAQTTTAKGRTTTPSSTKAPRGRRVTVHRPDSELRDAITVPLAAPVQPSDKVLDRQVPPTYPPLSDIEQQYRDYRFRRQSIFIVWILAASLITWAVGGLITNDYKTMFFFSLGLFMGGVIYLRWLP